MKWISRLVVPICILIVQAQEESIKVETTSWNPSDFYCNNLNQLRKGTGPYQIGQQGLTVTEPATRVHFVEYLSDKYRCRPLPNHDLTIHYQAQSKGILLIELFGKNTNDNEYLESPRTFSRLVDLMPGKNVITLPVKHLTGTPSACGQALELWIFAQLQITWIEFVPSKPTTLPVVPSPQFIDKYNTFIHELKADRNPGKTLLEFTQWGFFTSVYQDIVVRKSAQSLRKDLIAIIYGKHVMPYAIPDTRSIFSELSKVFNPPMGYFHVSNVDGVSLVLSPEIKCRFSWMRQFFSPSRDDYFRMCGRIIGMAIYHGENINAPLGQSISKLILNKKISLSDLQEIDIKAFESYIAILKDDSLSDRKLTLTCSHEKYGKSLMYEIVPTGRTIPVTEENVVKYVQGCANAIYNLESTEAIDALRDGIFEIVPEQFLTRFSVHELLNIMTGSRVVDVDDWQQSTKYDGLTPQSQQVQWFWEYVRQLSESERSTVFQWATGSPRIPVTGLMALSGGPFRLKKKVDMPTHNGKDRLVPKRHSSTVFLPSFESHDDLVHHFNTACFP